MCVARPTLPPINVNVAHFFNLQLPAFPWQDRHNVYLPEWSFGGIKIFNIFLRADTVPRALSL